MNLGIFNWIAFLSLFVAYVLLLKKKLTAQSHVYLILNLLGGISFVVVGVCAKAWSVWLFNGIWVGVTLYALYTIIFKKKSC